MNNNNSELISYNENKNHNTIANKRKFNSKQNHMGESEKLIVKINTQLLQHGCIHFRDAVYLYITTQKFTMRHSLNDKISLIVSHLSRIHGGKHFHRQNLNFSKTNTFFMKAMRNEFPYQPIMSKTKFAEFNNFFSFIRSHKINVDYAESIRMFSIAIANFPCISLHNASIASILLKTFNSSLFLELKLDIFTNEASINYTIRRISGLLSQDSKPLNISTNIKSQVRKKHVSLKTLFESLRNASKTFNYIR